MNTRYSLYIDLNALADTQITDLLPANRAIISQNHRFYDIMNTQHSLLFMMLMIYSANEGLTHVGRTELDIMRIFRTSDINSNIIQGILFPQN